MKYSLKDLLRTADLTRSDLLLLFDLAKEMKTEPGQYRKLLRDQSVVLFFAKSSTRTFISFEAAINRLGALPISVGPHELQLGRGETIEDTARVISSFARAFVIRTFSDEEVGRFAAAASIPVINALTDGHHPCQSVADLLTMRERFGSLEDCRLAYVGDGANNVTHSLMEGAALLGMDMAVATPPGYEPNPAVVAWVRAEIQHSGGRLLLTHDPAEAVCDARAVYTDVWLSMGDATEERATRAAALAPYRVDQALMARAASDALFMHCLPAHRGDEVTAAVIDGPQSVVFDQAANRLPTEQAILYALIEHKLAGRHGGDAREAVLTMAGRAQ